MEKIGYTTEEAAAAVGICRTKIFRAIKDGQLHARKYGKNTIIFADDLKAFVAALPIKEPVAIKPSADQT